MLQLSTWARLKAPPALVCTSCRHLLHHSASTSLPASPSTSRAAAASASTSDPLVKSGAARNKIDEAEKRPRRRSQSRGAKIREASSRQAARVTPTSSDTSGKGKPTENSEEAADVAKAERLLNKKLLRAVLAQEMKAQEAKAPEGGVPTETTDSTPKTSPYHPAQLDGAMKVLKSVLNKELYSHDRKDREAVPEQPKTKKTKQRKAERVASEDSTSPKSTKNPPKARRVISNDYSELAGEKRVTDFDKLAEAVAIAVHWAKVAGGAEAAIPENALKVRRVRSTHYTEVAEKKRAEAAERAAKAAERAAKAATRAKEKEEAKAAALEGPLPRVDEYFYNNTKLWDEKQAIPAPAPAPPVPAPPKRTRGVAHRLFQSVTPKVVSATNLDLVAVEKAQPPVPKLAYGLDRVLFNPGVYHLQDPRTRVYNFDPYLARIMPIKEFDFTALKQYITSSKDITLIDMAAKHERKYTGSTSSMTAMLAHFHFLLSAWRPINPLYQSAHFELESKNFSGILRAPAAAFLHYKDGVYAIDADKEFDTANILSMLGKSMEKHLTLPKEEFEKYRRTKSDQLSDEERNGPEAYHYTTMGDFMMRSQLDAFDPRIPGTGMFDLKTRAVASIRFGIRDIKKGLGYEIRDRVGQWESYEREYHDMIRSAFIKYSLQVRMGRMDGIFVAFHNTQRIFGFQYISLSEMDHTIHGTPNPHLGDREFKLSLHLLNELLDKATKKFPKRSLRLHFETRHSDPPFMYAFAEPVTPEEIEKVQGLNQKAVEEFENEMMGVKEEVREEEVAETTPRDVDEDEVDVDVEGEPYAGQETYMGAWEDIMDKVEEVLTDDEQGVTAVRESIESALQQSGLLHTRSSEEARSYMDALLEALTSSEEVAAADSNIEVEALDAERDLSSAEEDVLGSVEAAENSPETADAISAGVTATDGATSPESEDQAPTMEGEVEDESTEVSGETSASFDEPSLKDLILRLASQVKPKPQQLDQYEEEDVTEDTLNLRKFESILSELIAKNREISHPTVDDHEQHAAPTTSTAEEYITEDDIPSEDPEMTTPPPDTLAAEVIEEEQDPEELLGMIITVRNKINNEYVDRPLGMHPQARWDVEYVIEEIKAERAQTLYKMLKKRRKNTFTSWKEEKKTSYNSGFREKLAKYAERGRTFREQENRRNRGLPVHVYGMDEPLEWDSVFGGGEEEGDFHPDGTGYKEWKAAESGVKWQETEARREWARDLNMRPHHVPQFEVTSSYHADNPAAQARAAKVEAWKEELKVKNRVDAEARKMGGEGVFGGEEVGGLMGLSLNEVDEEK